MKQLRVLMASAEELMKPIFRRALGLISLLRLACNARVIVMSGVRTDGRVLLGKSVFPFMMFPMSGKQILKSVEKAAGMLKLSR